MMCWRRKDISWNDHVKNEKVLQRVKEESIILQTTKRRKANWISHILRSYDLIKYVTEVKTEGRSNGKARKKT
jgi:hypothetical protein